MIASHSPAPPLISIEDLQALASKLHPVIERAAEDGTLANAPYYGDLLRVWSYLGGNEGAKAWLQSGMDRSAEFLAKGTIGMVAYSISASRRKYSVHQRPDEAIYDLRAVLGACQKHLAGEDLNEDGRNRVQVVAQAIEKIIQEEDTPEPESEHKVVD